jgi:hypothetical protein
VGETRLQLVLQTAPVLDESVIIDDGNSEPNTHNGRQEEQEESAAAAEIEADSVDFELAADQGAAPATLEELDEESALSALVLLTVSRFSFGSGHRRRSQCLTSNIGVRTLLTIMALYCRENQRTLCAFN